MTKTVVVLGANYSGVPIAHHLLKQTAQHVPDLKVILVAPNTHMYWHNASVRAILPKIMPDEQVFFPIAPAFAAYPSNAYEIVLGRAEKLDPAAQTVEVATNDGRTRTIAYDSVVVATGSTFRESMPFKTVSTTEETRTKVEELRRRIQHANTIVVAGAGITGVEVAGELGTEYGTTKKIILVADKELPLDEPIKNSVRETVRRELTGLNVRIVSNSRVSSVTPVPSAGTDGPVNIQLATKGGKAQTLTADLFLPTYGVEPNTQFLPAEMLDVRGYVQQTTLLQAKGYDNVFVVGDAGNLETPQGVHTSNQTGHVVKILDAYLTGNAPLPAYKPDPKVFVGLSIGKGKGTGQMGNMRMFGFIITYFKSRTLGVDKAAAFVAGTHTVMGKKWASG